MMAQVEAETGRNLINVLVFIKVCWLWLELF